VTGHVAAPSISLAKWMTPGVGDLVLALGLGRYLVVPILYGTDMNYFLGALSH
jgi:hypothetical protein